MGNLGHLPWPLWETYGFHLDVLAALEGLCMAIFSVPWADAPARPAMVDCKENDLIRNFVTRVRFPAAKCNSTHNPNFRRHLAHVGSVTTKQSV